MRHSLSLAILILAACLGTLVPSPGASAAGAEREFVVTAYYSPLPNQCCYVKGSYEADRILNGNGTHGASGRPVYPGMIAAPASYAFGTRVELPELGMVGTVADRGGAIVEKEGYDRLDIWMGEGEEGLARALAFGVRRVKGRVHAPGSAQPAERVSLAAYASPFARLAAFAVPGERVLLTLKVRQRERSPAVRLLQERLAALGYFRHALTGLYGDVTAGALGRFQQDYGLTEPADQLSERTAAYLEAASERVAARDALITEVDQTSGHQDVLSAKRTLRFLGYYRGRTTGVYDDALAAAILRFQQDHRLVGGPGLPGAGRIGPVTKRTVLQAWERRIVASRAERLLLLLRVERKLAESGRRVEAFAGRGERGEHVRVLQRFLAARKYLPSQSVTGWFGSQTLRAVLAYQLERKIIPSAADPAAGFVGPATLAAMQREQRQDAYRIVRSAGWEAL